MAGHSKWANIKHRKGAQDARKGKLFTKIIREISISAKLGGGDASANPRLRAAIDKAMGENMTRDVVNRAIARGVGGDAGDNMEDIRYEGYGPGGVAVMVDCLSDNRNRTVSDVRFAFTKSGGNLGTDGSVAYLFDKQSQILVAEFKDEDKLMEVALDGGAVDVKIDGENAEVLAMPEDHETLVEMLKKNGFTIESAEITYLAKLQVAVEDLEIAQKLIKLVDTLEDLDDVQSVYSNAEIAESLLAEMA